MLSFKIRFRIYDLLFYLLLVFSFYYTRNMLCRLMMVMFFCCTVLQMAVSRRKVPLPFFYTGFFAFILYGAVNLVLENVIDAQVARTMVVSLALNFMMIFAIVQYIYMTDDVPKVLRVTELGIFTTAFVVGVLSIRTITQGRLGGGTEMNANMLSLLCVYGFVLSMYLQKIGKFTKHTCWFRLFFYAMAVLLTGSRKGLLMIVLAIVVVQFVLERKKVFRNILIGMGVVVALYILIMNVEVLYNIIGVRIENLITVLSGGTTTEASLNDRQELIEKGLEYIKKKPWTGYGYDCFKLVSGIGEQGIVVAGEVGFYSHNNYIELLFGGGIIGFILYYIPMSYLLKKLLKGIYNNACIPYLLAIFVSKLAVEYAYVSYYERVDAYIIAIILGCVLVHKKKQDGDMVSQEVNLC